MSALNTLGVLRVSIKDVLEIANSRPGSAKLEELSRNTRSKATESSHGMQISSVSSSLHFWCNLFVPVVCTKRDSISTRNYIPFVSNRRSQENRKEKRGVGDCDWSERTKRKTVYVLWNHSPTMFRSLTIILHAYCEPIRFLANRFWPRTAYRYLLASEVRRIQSIGSFLSKLVFPLILT